MLPVEPAAAQEWARIVDTARDLAVDVVASRVGRRGAPRDGWERGYLASVFDRGVLADAEIEDLAGRLDRVDDWRRRQTVGDDDLRPLGDRPVGPDGEEWDELTAGLLLTGAPGVELAV